MVAVTRLTENKDNGRTVTVYRYFSEVLNSCKVFDKSLDRFFGAWIELLVSDAILQNKSQCISYT